MYMWEMTISTHRTHQQDQTPGDPSLRNPQLISQFGPVPMQKVSQVWLLYLSRPRPKRAGNEGCISGK